MIQSQRVIASILAMDSYNRGYGEKIINPGGHAPTSPNKLGNIKIAYEAQPTLGQANSFYGIAYEYAGQFYLSYRGTDYYNNPDDGFFSNIKALVDGDVWEGWRIGSGSKIIGADTDQSELAFELYQSVVNHVHSVSGHYFDSDVILTGHSLGGGLAGLVAGVYGLEAVLFDNMPFQKGAETLVESISDFSSCHYSQYNRDVVLSGYFDQENLDADFSNISAYSIDREVLSPLRLFQNVEGNSFSLGNDVSLYADPSDASILSKIQEIFKDTSPLFLALDAVQRHSMPALVIRVYGEDVVKHKDWQASAKYYWPILYDAAFAAGVGFNDTEKFQGLHMDGGKYADVMQNVLAYSALPNGPYGDTAIHAFYDDANDLGRLFNSGKTADFMAPYAVGISKVFTHFAGQLGLNQIKIKNNSDVLNGVLETEGQSLIVNVSNTSWTQLLGTDNHNLDIAKTYLLEDFSSSIGDTDVDIDKVIFAAAASQVSITSSIPETTSLYIGSDSDDVLSKTTGTFIIDGGVGYDHLNYNNVRIQNAGEHVAFFLSVPNQVITNIYDKGSNEIKFSSTDTINNIEELSLTNQDDNLVLDASFIVDGTNLIINAGKGANKAHLSGGVYDTRNQTFYNDAGTGKIQLKGFEETETYEINALIQNNLYERAGYDYKIVPIHDFSTRNTDLKFNFDFYFKAKLFWYTNRIDSDFVHFGASKSISINDDLYVSLGGYAGNFTLSYNTEALLSANLNSARETLPKIIGTNFGDTIVIDYNAFDSAPRVSPLEFFPLVDFISGTGNDTVKYDINNRPNNDHEYLGGVEKEKTRFQYTYTGGHDTIQYARYGHNIYVDGDYNLKDTKVINSGDALTLRFSKGNSLRLSGFIGNLKVPTYKDHTFFPNIFFSSGDALEHNGHRYKKNFADISAYIDEPPRFITGNWGDNHFIGEQGKEQYFYGKAGNDYIKTGDKSDNISSGLGNDVVDGGAGSDIYNYSGGHDKIIDISGIDTIALPSIFSLSSINIIEQQKGDTFTFGSVDNSLLIEQQTNENAVIEFVSHDGISYDYKNFKKLVQSGQNIYIQDDPDKRIFNGKSYDDYLIGNKFDNQLYGGNGNDIIIARGGRDILDGGAGDDVLNLGTWLEDSDELKTQYVSATGGSGNDIFVPNFFGPETAIIQDFEPGKDKIDFRKVSEVYSISRLFIYSNEQDVVIRYNPVSDFGSSYLTLKNIDKQNLTTDSFLFSSKEFNIQLPVAPKNEYIGTISDDTIVPRNNIGIMIKGLQGNDVINGSDNTDYLHGDDYFGSLYNYPGENTLNGFEGDDVLFASSGFDRMNGDEGNDVYVLDYNTIKDGVIAYDRISDVSGEDMIVLPKGIQISDLRLERQHNALWLGSNSRWFAATIEGQFSNNGIELIADGSKVYLLDDVITDNYTAKPVFQFEEDIITQLKNGGKTQDTVAEDFADPALIVLPKNASFNALETENKQTPENLEISAANTNDIIVAGSGDDFVDGNKGKDFLAGSSGNDIINGGEHTDKIIGGFDTGSFVINDSNFASAINGGDILSGGAGVDFFKYNKKGSRDEGTDIILDFEDNIDKLIVYGSHSLIDVVNGTVVDFGNNHGIIVEHITAQNLVNDIIDLTPLI